MTLPLPTSTHSAAAAALRFLFEANRNAGLPQRVCGVVDTDAGYETAQRQAYIFIDRAIAAIGRAAPERGENVITQKLHTADKKPA